MNAVALDKSVNSVETSEPVVQRKVMLNLGCGADFHPAFVNVDLLPRPGVIGHDLRKGIPFPDATYDLVYHSTMLSHLRPTDALGLTRECYRVLKPGGVLRVVTEDLEQMCRVYLEKLELAWKGDAQSARDYEWMLLELYDQATRENTGGQMASFVSQPRASDEAFICSRVGEQGRRMFSGARSSSPAPTGHALKGAAIRAWKRALTMLLGSEGLHAYETGRFRLNSGEVSYRMYDRHSLRELFRSAGFSNVALRTARESGCAEWAQVNLDVSSNGEAARPHTLIMEGVRPAR
jgi:SAM-dependent methyltransferase